MSNEVVHSNVSELQIRGPGTLSVEPTGALVGAQRVKRVGANRLLVELDSDDGDDGGNGCTSMITSSGSVTFSGGNGGMSISNNVVRSGASSVQFKNGGRHLVVRTPEASTLVLNGKKLSVADLMRGKITKQPAYVQAAKHRLAIESFRLRRVVVSGGAHLEMRAALCCTTQTLRVKVSGKSTVTLPPITLKELDVNLSGVSVCDGGDIRATELRATLCGVSVLRRVSVLQHGELDVSGVSNATVSAYARECIERECTGSSKITINLLKDERAPTPKRARKRAAAVVDLSENPDCGVKRRVQSIKKEE